MKVSIIGTRLASVPKEDLGEIAYATIQALQCLGELGEFVEEITIEYAFMNSILGPMFKIHFKKFRGKNLWITTDFRFIKEMDDERRYPDVSVDTIVKHLVKTVKDNLSHLLERQKLDLQDDIEKINTACSSC